MTSRAQYVEELLSDIESPGQLLRLWADGEAVVRGYTLPPPAAVHVRTEILKLRQWLAYYCHEMVVNAEVVPEEWPG